MSAVEHKDEGTRYFKAKQYAEAVRSYTSAIGVESDPVELAKLLGNRSTSYGLLNKHVEALSDAKRALQQDANYLKGYFRQATALMALSRFAEAGAAATEGLAHDPNNKQLQQLQQEARAKSSQAAPQSSNSDMADDDDDDDDDDDIDDDIDDDDDMEDDDDDDDDDDDGEPMVAAPPTPVLSPAEQAEQRKEAGNVLYKQGEYEGAVRLYTAAIQVAPTNPAYLLNRAAALLMLQRAGDALGDAQASLALDATSLKAHARVAKCLLQLGRFSDARRQLESASALPNAQATLAPDYATLTELETLMRNGKSALAQEGGAAGREALRCFGALAERCQQSLVIACMLMECMLRASPERGASQVVSESARWMRKAGCAQEPDLLCVRGKALYGIGQLEDALKHFSEALKLDPDHSSSRQMRNQIKELERLKRAGNEAFSAGNFAEAEKQYSEALQVEGLPQDVSLTLLTNRATARFRARKFDGSLQDCDAALAIKPGHVKALLRRATVYMEIENWKAAIGAYEAAQEADPEDRNVAQGLRQAKLELKKSLRKDLYKVLGIDKRASDQEIKKGYKMSAMRCHPDRHASGSDEDKAKAEVQFKEVGEAFEILSDPEKKQRYDQGEDVEEINGNSGRCSHGGGGGMSQADIFNMFNSQMGGGGGMPRGSRGGGGGFPGGFPGGGF